jgi:hypothetical protein
MFNTIVGAGAGAASHYGSGSDQKMRLQLRLRNTGLQYLYLERVETNFAELHHFDTPPDPGR